MVRRYAFTLIELLFAIIIIAISVLSLPMMNQAIEKGETGNVLQEAIFSASTQLNDAISARWDENSFNPGETDTAMVIDVSHLCDDNKSSPRYRYMPGQVHRKCLDSNSTAPSDIDIPGVDSIADKAHTTLTNIFINSSSNAKGYKNEYKSKLVVTRPVDFNGSNGNIKKVESTITDSSGNILVALKTYIFNIGDADIYTNEVRP